MADSDMMSMCPFCRRWWMYNDRIDAARYKVHRSVCIWTVLCWRTAL